MNLKPFDQKSALAAFHLDEKKWGVNVQPLSGSPANFQVYTAIFNPHDRIMGLDLPHGGHLSHGFMTPKRRVFGTSIYFESMPYRLDESTGLVDYDMLEKTETHYCWCQCCWCFSMMDMVHISGLVASFVVGDPFKYCDIVTTTTHKGGPHNHTIGGLAVCSKHAESPEFKNYQEKVVSNCRALAKPID
ncbi:hypothetical protein ACOSQ4_008561 [Xanthoceras sorbifolium]